MSVVRQSRSEEGVVTLQLDAPPANAMGAEALRTLMAALDEIEEDLSCRVVILTGSGRAFCSGADLKDDAADLTAFGRLLDRIESLRCPVIAAINGFSIGGGLELALCCDIRIASEDATFTCAGVNVGLMASTYRLPRLIGLGRAKAMLLTGLPHSAASAEQFGLVTTVCARDQLMEAASAIATRIATRAPLSVEAAKRTVSQALNLSDAEMGRLVAVEVRALSASIDHAEAIAAFRQKRPPRFTRS